MPARRRDVSVVSRDPALANRPVGCSTPPYSCFQKRAVVGGSSGPRQQHQSGAVNGGGYLACSRHYGAHNWAKTHALRAGRLAITRQQWGIPCVEAVIHRVITRLRCFRATPAKLVSSWLTRATFCSRIMDACLPRIMHSCRAIWRVGFDHWTVVTIIWSGSQQRRRPADSDPRRLARASNITPKWISGRPRLPVRRCALRFHRTRHRHRPPTCSTVSRVTC